MIDFDTAPEIEDQPREKLCKLNGITYTIPLSYPARESLAWGTLVGTRGPMFAVAWVMEHVMGPEGVVALTESPHVNDEAYNQLVKIVTLRYQGLTKGAPEDVIELSDTTYPRAEVVDDEVTAESADPKGDLPEPEPEYETWDYEPEPETDYDTWMSGLSSGGTPN